MKIHADYRDLKTLEEAPGVDVRVVIGPEENAPNFVMRVLEVGLGASTPFHSHPWEHEVYTISGRGAVRSESGETKIEAGTVVYVPPDEQHCFTNVGEEPLRFVCVIPKLD